MENVGGQASSEAPEAIDQPIRIQAVLSPKFNLAFLQNSVPVLLELALVNDSDKYLSDLTLTLSSTPSFLKTKIWHINAISSGQKFHISDYAVSYRWIEKGVFEKGGARINKPEAKALFHEGDPASVAIDINPDAFFNAEYDAALQNMIAHSIEMEGPVREDVLAKRIARVHGWARTGKRIKDRVLALALNEYPVTEEDVGRFFWPKGNDVCEWTDIC